ncbi:transposase [Schaedlerella arabinosiphila]|uniref:Transposase n=1 Tax=Schaedlerella arabinosiphila TaxID=2044587 RepID=A0A9X5C3X3_9FIRM|nr:transposase [Schaedlerella arabinosiphila]
MMRRLAEDASHIFLACGATDFRKQISGLVSIVSMQFTQTPHHSCFITRSNFNSVSVWKSSGMNSFIP